jgi:hypothetical protein
VRRRHFPTDERKKSMINARYKKLVGMHAGHTYIVTAPYDEIDPPLRWMLHCETVTDEKLIVDEDELSDNARWQPLE